MIPRQMNRIAQRTAVRALSRAASSKAPAAGVKSATAPAATGAAAAAAAKSLKSAVPSAGMSTYAAPGRTVPLPEELAGINSKVLDDEQLKSRLDSEVWAKFVKSRESGRRMDKKAANGVAKAIREWAQEQGCISYSHHFQPIRGLVAGEKMETFLSLDFSSGKLIVDLSGTELLQSESDGSSFPNGGLRTTHNAAAYIGWDLNANPFIIGDVVYLPSAFVSWTGEALDQKSALLKSNDAVNRESVRFLHHLGEKRVKKVESMNGWEQEFFVLDRASFLARPDLVATGRTLLGATPLHGQELSANYFAKVPLRVREYINEARRRMWEVGISIDCSHNEVAPSQHEISPIFTATSTSADHNMFACEILRDLAYEMDLAVLFHEKPFKDINGTGKHNNWGLNTDTGDNLFVPGSSDKEQRRFFAFVAALTSAVKKHGDLLRIGVSTAGNDHRLGAQEAPPPIFTLALGANLEAHVKRIANGGPLSGYNAEDKFIPVASGVPEIKGAGEDRNRTAPFPWCGNRFEFRAVGGNQHIGFPLSLVNVIVANELATMSERVEAGEAVDDVIRSTLKEAEGALFSGNGYDSALLQQHADENGLFHLRTSPEAFAELTSAKNVALFEKTGLYTANEAQARKNILSEEFSTTLDIEARTLLHMVRTGVLPAVLEDVAAETASGFTGALIDAKKADVQALIDAAGELQAAIDNTPDAEPVEVAQYANDTLKVAMNNVREYADRLEYAVDASKWPFPHYDEILHQHH